MIIHLNALAIETTFFGSYTESTYFLEVIFVFFIGDFSVIIGL